MFAYLEPDEPPMWFPDDDSGLQEYEREVSRRYGYEYEPVRQPIDS